MNIPVRTLNVITVCPFCGREYMILVNEDNYVDYLDGSLIQHCFPYLTADEREMIKTGICPDCWDRMFGGE